MNKNKNFFITSKKIIAALSLKKQKLNILKNFVNNIFRINFYIIILFINIFISTSVAAIFPSVEERFIINKLFYKMK